MSKKIAVFGGSSAIAQALVLATTERYPDAQIHVFSRQKITFFYQSDSIFTYIIDYQDERQLQAAASILDRSHNHDFSSANLNSITQDIEKKHDGVRHTSAKKLELWDELWICLGSLHTEDIMPEKSLKELSLHQFEHSFRVNCIFPALITKAFSARLVQKNSLSTHNTPDQQVGFISILSAKVGSVSDNKLGGWYAYRCSKAALNMFIKNTSIELARTHPGTVVVGIHPGTVRTKLSEPWLKNIKHPILEPAESASSIRRLMDKLNVSDSGKLWSWQGQEIQP